MARADARAGIGEFIRFRVGNELRHVVHRQRRMHGEHQRDVRGERDGGKRRLRIERKVLLQKSVGGQRRVDREEKRVAVGLGVGHGGSPGRATRTAPVIDDDILPERLAQRLAQDARHRVGGPSRREVDDERDGTVGIVLCCRSKRRRQRGRRTAESEDEFAAPHWLLHGPHRDASARASMVSPSYPGFASLGTNGLLQTGN